MVAFGTGPAECVQVHGIIMARRHTWHQCLGHAQLRVQDSRQGSARNLMVDRSAHRKSIARGRGHRPELSEGLSFVKGRK